MEKTNKFRLIANSIEEQVKKEWLAQTEQVSFRKYLKEKINKHFSVFTVTPL